MPGSHAGARLPHPARRVVGRARRPRGQRSGRDVVLTDIRDVEPDGRAASTSPADAMRSLAFHTGESTR